MEGSGEAGGETGGVARAVTAGTAGTVNLGQAIMLLRSSDRVILSSGLRVNILPKMSFSSFDKGRIVFKKSWLLVKARYVESSKEACFHGLRPQVRFTRMTPRLQTSLGAQ